MSNDGSINMTEVDGIHIEGDLDTALKVVQALGEVRDPEIPTVSIVDLGMVNSVEVNTVDRSATITLTPTFIGCPALAVIRRNVESSVHNQLTIDNVQVQFVFDHPWTTDRIRESGREKLKAFGISPPKCSLYAMRDLHATCPYCDSEDTRLENLFGPTACRSLFYCNTCKQPFEAMKPI